MGGMGLSCMVYSFALPKLSPNSLKYCYKTDIWCQGSSKTLAEFSSKGPGSQYFGDSEVKWSLLQLINSAIMEQKQPQTLCKQMGTGRSLCAMCPWGGSSPWWPSEWVMSTMFCDKQPCSVLIDALLWLILQSVHFISGLALFLLPVVFPQHHCLFQRNCFLMMCMK